MCSEQGDGRCAGARLLRWRLISENKKIKQLKPSYPILISPNICRQRSRQPPIPVRWLATHPKIGRFSQHYCVWAACNRNAFPNWRADLLSLLFALKELVTFCGFGSHMALLRPSTWHPFTSPLPYYSPLHMAIMVLPPFIGFRT